jgi:hypothetical protein
MAEGFMKIRYSIVFCFALSLLPITSSFAEEVDNYTNEDYMVDPKISKTEQGKIKRQVGEAGYDSISVDHVIAGERFDDNSVTESDGDGHTSTADSTTSH